MRERITESPALTAGLKAALVGLLVLVLLIPIGMIKALRSERQDSMTSALREVSAMAGGETVMASPYLAVPTLRTERRLDAEGKSSIVTVRETYCVFPTSMKVSGSVAVSERWRGIYAVPVHRADFVMDLAYEFSLDETEVAGIGADWGSARLYYAYDDPRSLRESPILVDGNGTRRELRSGLAPVDLADRAVSVPVSLSVGPDSRSGRLACRLELSLSGARSVKFLPLADLNSISLSGDWPSPSFSGYRLPADRSLDETGFRAAWFVDESGRTVPRVAESGSFRSGAARSGAFGVDFFTPTDIYQQVHRALRYAVLFLVIPFAALFLVETLSRRRLHPVQYLLIGLANCVFYLLLLAFAEHLPFLVAYLVSAAAVSALTAFYVGAVLPGRRTGLYAFIVLALQYGYLFCALDSEDYALIIGAVGLFLLVAVAMVATRNVDWYGARSRQASRPESTGVSAGPSGGAPEGPTGESATGSGEGAAEATAPGRAPAGAQDEGQGTERSPRVPAPASESEDPKDNPGTSA